MLINSPHMDHFLFRSGQSLKCKTSVPSLSKTRQDVAQRGPLKSGGHEAKSQLDYVLLCDFRKAT